MRQRKRAEWPIAVYHYWIRLEHQSWSSLPESVKQEIEAMRLLWNNLVDLFEQQVGHQPHLLPPQPTAKPESSDVLGADSQRQCLHFRAFQQLFLPAARRLITKSMASWSNKEFVLTQFLAALRRFFRGHGRPPKRKPGTPQNVHLRHRFTGGGLPAERIFGRGQRVHLEPVPPAAFDLALPQRRRKRLARTSGTFQVGNVSLAFATLLHRPLPEGAYLKAAALIGKQVLKEGYYHRPLKSHIIPAQWTWSLQLTLEHPPLVQSAPRREQPTAAVDLGYRMCPDGRLRIGVLSDAQGHETPLFLPDTILTAWRHKRTLQRQADLITADTKAFLQSQGVESSSSALPASAGMSHAADLWRLFQTLEKTEQPEEAQRMLRQWANRVTRLIREARGLERRCIGHRTWFYRRLALDLCQRYSRIVIETLDLPALSSRQHGRQSPRLQHAAKYRQLVALSQLIAFLRQAAAKTGTHLLAVDPSFSTRECHICGARVSGGLEELVLVCANGHQWDQDYNAAQNLLMRAAKLSELP